MAWTDIVWFVGLIIVAPIVAAIIIPPSLFIFYWTTRLLWHRNDPDYPTWDETKPWD